MTLPVRALILSVAILAPLHAQMPAEKPPEKPPEARLLDTYRLRARQARTARMVALAEALLTTRPAEARALLEDPESCSPEDHDGRWLKAWRQTQETSLRLGDSSGGVVFSPDGRFLAQPESGRLFRADTGERVEPKSPFQAFTFAADAKSAFYLFSGESLYSLPLETLKPVRAGIDYHFPYAPRRTLLGVGPGSKSIYLGEGGTVYRLALVKGAKPEKADLVGGAQALTRDGKLLLALRRDGESLLVNRAAALKPLATRSTKEYAGVIGAALSYPWPAVARNAAEAAAALRRTDLIPELVDMLEADDPRAPVKGVARELVRINHHHNCLMCHAPATGAEREGQLLVADIPLPSRQLPQTRPSEGGYGPPHSNLLVRIDVTYLRQDFSMMQRVEAPHAWPYLQRFDFVVRKRTLTEAEAADLRDRLTPKAGELSPYRQAALDALRKLTGRELDANAATWRKHLGLASS